MSTVNENRLLLEGVAVGVLWPGFSGGEPNIHGYSKNEADILNALVKAHIGDDAEYAATNLESNEDAQHLKALLKAEQWAAYVDVQSAVKQEVRTKEYEATNKEFFNVAYDLLKSGKTLTATNMAPWLSKVDVIKTKIPFEVAVK
jgi:hypothetical protein